LSEKLEVVEALLPILAHVVEKDSEALASEIEIDAVDLPKEGVTSSSTIAFPTPPPDPLFMNNRIGLESPCIKVLL
jgi:hypothetical protein